MAIGRLAAYVLLVLAPFTAFAPLGPPIAPGIVPLYVQAVVELADAAAIAVVLAGAMVAWRDRPAAALVSEVRFTRALFVLAALGLVSSPFALAPPLAAYSALRWLLAAGVAWGLVRVRVAPAAAATVLCLGLVAQVAVGIAQILVQSPLGLPGERALPPGHPAAAVVATGAAHWLRAYGLTFHPNVLGGFLGAGILLALPYVDRLALRAIWWLLWLGLFLTFSRSAWLATALLLPVSAAALFRHRPALRGPLFGSLAGAVVICATCAALLAPQLATRLGPAAAALGAAPASPPAERLSLAGREEMIGVALVAIREHPWTGVGAGNFPLEMLRHRTATPAQYVHNIPLLLAAEVGMIAALVWVALCVAGVAALARAWRHASPQAVAVLSAWCAVGVIALFDCYPWSLQAGRLLTAITVGLADRVLATERNG